MNVNQNRSPKPLPNQWKRLQTKGMAAFGSLFLLMLFPIAGLWAQTTLVYDTPGDYIVDIPVGATHYQLEMWGGGESGSKTAAGRGGSYVLTKKQSILQYFSAVNKRFRIKVGGSDSSSGYYLPYGADTPETWGEFVQSYSGAFNYFPYPYINPDVLEMYNRGGQGGIGCNHTYNPFYMGGGGGSSGSASSGWGTDGTSGSCNDQTNGQGGQINGGGSGGYGVKYFVDGFWNQSFTAPQDGFAPGGGGGGGSLNGGNGPYAKGGNGRVKVTYWCEAPNPGIIESGLTIVNPSEMYPSPIRIWDIKLPSGTYGDLGYQWQRSNDGLTGWTNIPNTNAYYYYEYANIVNTTYYRRATVGCGPTTYSNVARIKVMPRNGTISGFVRSTGGVGVQGITIKITKKTALPGSPKKYEYSDTTRADGSYNIPVYYGDIEEAGGLSISTGFWISASKHGHVFTNDSLERTLSNTLFNISQVDFVDETAYSITGRVFQKCGGCLNTSNVASTITSNLDGINIYNKGKFQMTTRYLDQQAAYGSWAVTVLNQGSYPIRPELAGRKFVPDSTIVQVVGNISNVVFEDTTTHLITGLIGDGCKVKTGEAVLEFRDVLLDKNGRLRGFEFRKRVTTVDGAYAIRLPARKYQVSVVSYTNDAITSAPIEASDFLAFFNSNADSGMVANALPYDSLLADISNGDKALNLYYQRTPVLELVNLDNQICNSSILSFVVFPQSLAKPYQVKVWQGPKNLGCRLSDDSVVINTNVQKDDENERRVFKVSNGSVQDTLIGGVPKIIGDFVKVFYVTYKDRYGRAAVSLDKNAVVTGIKADNASSFATTSPQVPIMVLHDPPGDQSYSYWETSQTIERAMSWSVASDNSVEGWLKVKLGTKFQVGLGVTTGTEIWGSLNSSINVTSRTSEAEESIISTTTTQNISTSADEDVTGNAGDLFIGAAINLLYTRSYEVKINDQCLLEAPKRLMIAQNGFGTQYVYTDAAIRQNVIPTLQGFAVNPGSSQEERNGYLNQVSVWQQVLTNNDINKRRAVFDKNISFFGSSGPITNTTSTSATQSSTIEFDMEIDVDIATELGCEIAGSGVSGGYNVHFKTETGSSRTNSLTRTTTIGYTLDDNDALDNFSVNVRKDPVYNTPVFQTVAGQSSCPAEESTLARDEMYFQIENPEVSVGANEEAVFNFELGNLSVDVNPRTYNLTFDQGSNPFGAAVYIGGIPMGFSAIPYAIDQMDVVNVTVNVKRNTANNTYTYEGLRFYLKDACTGQIYKTGTITAHFQTPCSPVSLVSPAEGWLSNQADNNLVSIQFNNYQIPNLQRIAMEFCKVGSNNWRTGFTRLASELGTGINGTTMDWNTSTIVDGSYYIRLKLTCASGIIYSQRVTGTIDRAAPVVFGVPQPSDGVYSLGDELSFTYNENLDLSELNNGQAELTRLSNSAVLPVLVSGFENKLMIMPSSSLLSYSGETLRLIVKDISDAQGNVKTTVDTIDFVVGNFTPATGNNALQITLNQPSVIENSVDPLLFRFALPQNATNDVQVNFSIGGTATISEDYTWSFSNTHNLNDFNGTQGTIMIPKGKSFTLLRIYPKADAVAELNETILLSLSEGGDYQIGASYQADGSIIDNSLAAPTISGMAQFCPGSTTVLTANHAEAGNPAYSILWSNGETTPTIQATVAGTYTVSITQNGTGITGTSEGFVLSPLTAPGTNAGPDFSVVQNIGNLTLGGSPSGGSWSGTGVTGNSFNTAMTWSAYTLTYCYTNAEGCSKCDFMVLTITAGTPDPVAKPVFSEAAGNFSGPINVSISCATPGAAIYYTTTGNTPVIGTGFTKLYTGPVAISVSTNLKAMGVLPGSPNSYIASSLYTMAAPMVAATPVISVPTGSYPNVQVVSLSTSTPGAQIYYTTSGNTPVIGTGFTKLYTTPFTLITSATVRAMTVVAGMTNSYVAVSYITVAASAVVATPQIGTVAGSLSGTQMVRIITSTPSANIYYTTNGNTPRLDVANGFTKLYTGPFPLGQTTTIRAIATAPGLPTSYVALALFPSTGGRMAVAEEGEETDSKTSEILANPNPSDGLYTLQLPANYTAEVREIEIISLSGQVIRREEIDAADMKKKIDIRPYPTGIYILKIRTGTELKIIRLSKQ